jgi:polysaccharide pyruvyl transferase WcaK-like protein
MIKTVCLLGSAAGRNAGDAALISGIMEAIDHRLQRSLTYRIPTLFPSFVEKTYRANKVEAVNIMPWTGSLKLMGFPTYRAVTRSDLSLVFDAVLFDRSLFNPMFNFLSSLAWLLPAAKKAGRKVGLYNCGVGPITTPLGERMLRAVCDSCDFMTVRDEGSADVLRRIGIAEDRFTVTADAALNAPGIPDDEISAIFNKIGLDPSGDILAININKYLHTWSDQRGETLTTERFLDEVAAAINKLSTQVTAPLLLVVTYHGDIELTKALKSRLRVPQKVVMIDNKEYDHYQIKGVLSKVSMLFAMRLHAMILASSSGTPIAGLAYQPKVQHYFDHLAISDACTDFSGFGAQQLHDFILKTWNNRQAMRETLKVQVPLMQKRALVAADCVASLDV